MSKIRTVRHVIIENDPRELGENVAESNSDAFAEFLIGMNHERKHWNWENFVIDVARDLTIDDAREVHEMLHILTEAIRYRVENDT